ncbi:MAG: RNA polymerase sigma factor [Myxococcota bacterium]
MTINDDPRPSGEPADRRSSDAELLHLWQSGVVEAGTTLLRRYEPVVRRYFVPRVAEPCDLVQQTFLVCTQNVHRIQDSRKFAPFLMGVARRVWLEHVRKGRAQTDRVTALSHEPSPTASSPVQVVSMLESGHHLEVAVEDLPPQWKQAVVQHYWHDRSIAEIARLASVAEGTVKSWLARARSALKRKLSNSKEIVEPLA